MSTAKLAVFACKFCGKGFDDGRKLGGHVRQSHSVQKRDSIVASPAPAGEGEIAARVLEMWKNGTEPFTIVLNLKVHPRFVREVLKEYDELLNEWRKFKEA